MVDEADMTNVSLAGEYKFEFDSQPPSHKETYERLKSKHSTVNLPFDRRDSKTAQTFSDGEQHSQLIHVRTIGPSIAAAHLPCSGKDELFWTVDSIHFICTSRTFQLHCRSMHG